MLCMIDVQRLNIHKPGTVASLNMAASGKLQAECVCLFRICPQSRCAVRCDEINEQYAGYLAFAAGEGVTVESPCRLPAMYL